jgi:hypothetical protein
LVESPSSGAIDCPNQNKGAFPVAADDMILAAATVDVIPRAIGISGSALFCP